MSPFEHPRRLIFLPICCDPTRDVPSRLRRAIDLLHFPNITLDQVNSSVDPSIAEFVPCPVHVRQRLASFAIVDRPDECVWRQMGEPNRQAALRWNISPIAMVRGVGEGDDDDSEIADGGSIFVVFLKQKRLVDDAALLVEVDTYIRCI